jgi:hypothetical protein
MPALGFTRLVVVVVFALVWISAGHAQGTEKRIALVIGNGAYGADTLSTPANDAGLVAQTLQAAGFDVVGARDLDTATLRASFREFIDKATASGPDTVALVYFAGFGLQFEGENYLVPVDAHIARASTNRPTAPNSLGTSRGRKCRSCSSNIPPPRHSPSSQADSRNCVRSRSATSTAPTPISRLLPATR